MAVDIVKKCFTTSLLIYSWKFIKVCEANFLFKNNASESLTLAWFNKVSFLIRNHNYDYKEFGNLSFFHKKFKSRKSFSVKKKIVEFSFCFLIVSFFKFFSYSVLDKYV
jgi:hypothetical protein